MAIILQNICNTMIIPTRLTVYLLKVFVGIFLLHSTWKSCIGLLLIFAHHYLQLLFPLWNNLTYTYPRTFRFHCASYNLQGASKRFIISFEQTLPSFYYFSFCLSLLVPSLSIPISFATSFLDINRRALSFSMCCLTLPLLKKSSSSVCFPWKDF